MAGVFTKFGQNRKDCLVSFMVIGPTNLCDKVSKELQRNAKKRKWYIVVHQCESTAKIVNSDLDLDYIVFVFDWRISQSVSEVEDNIGLIDEQFIISGSVCLVNNKEVSFVRGLTSHKLTNIREKYNIPFLSADFSEPQDCIQLGDRILNFADATLGITSGIPAFNCLL